ncbi:MAG TPA: PilZ domain-containing protein, partial [Gemmataceae bacterium]|nr:PilZ domain-containing protein [Gemmataceae bacterium]
QEVLTGKHPFCGQARQRSGAERSKARPDLAALSPGDRDVIARALETDPGQRWPSCTEVVSALEGSDKAAPEEPPDEFVASLRAQGAAPLPGGAGISQDSLNDIIRELLASAGGDLPTEAEMSPPEPLPTGDGLRHRFRAGLPVGAARLQLDAFRRRWEGHLLRDDEEDFAFQVSIPTNFWRQWIGRQPVLQVRIHLSRPHALSATPIDVNVELKTLHCGKKRAAQLLQDVGAPLLENLHAHLLMNSEKRTQDRLLWPYPVEICCVLPDGKLSDPIECRGKDISPSGIGFYLPHELPTSQVCVNLPTMIHPPHLSVPATLVRAYRCADGWYDVGALFRLATLRKSLPELCQK